DTSNCLARSSTTTRPARRSSCRICCERCSILPDSVGIRTSMAAVAVYRRSPLIYQGRHILQHRSDQDKRRPGLKGVVYETSHPCMLWKSSATKILKSASQRGSTSGWNSASFEELIGENPDQDHCSHYREVERAGNAQQVHEILQNLKQGRTYDYSYNRPFSSLKAAAAKHRGGY